jgi:hypothetical protein
MILSARVSPLAKKSTERFSGNPIGKIESEFPPFIATPLFQLLTAKIDMQSGNFVEKRIKDAVESNETAFD